ncbi:PA2817 family protein [Oceanobacter mangrovi]|uniref:PA2817 family protein n=1 Tax=Oceanobacter mangrovi TaxID=2862510 RepID=UPI001C8E7E74|nr:PA2817 family protein [Oceanobacter mangrovi]
MNQKNDHIELLQALKSRLKAANESDVITEDMIQQLDDLIDQLTQHTSTAYDDTRDWVANILQFTPQLTPAIDRQLLWLLGGDCLHYLTDEEIAQFQTIDDASY